MSKRLYCLIVVVALVVLPPVTAAAEDISVIAVVNFVGSGENTFKSDVEVLAEGPEAAQFTMHLLDGSATPPQVTRSLPPDTAVRFADIVNGQFGLINVLGGLRIAPTTGSLRVTSRYYLDTGGSGTFGQAVSVRPQSGSLAAGDQGSLIQLTENGSWRTNLLLLNTSETAIAIDIDLFEADGSHLGTLLVMVPGNESEQVQRPFAAVTASDVEDGYIVVGTSTSEGSFIAEASVVNNVTGDTAGVPTLTSPSATPVLVPFAVHSAGSGTDLEVFATDDGPAVVDVQLLITGADNTSPATHTLAVGTGEAVRLVDVVGSEFGHTGTGALRVTPTSGTILVNAICWVDPSAPSRFLRQIPGTPTSDAFTTGNAAVLMGLDETGTMSSTVGVVSASSSAMDVVIDLYLAEGTPAGRFPVALAPYGHAVVEAIFTEVGSADVVNGFAVVRSSTVGGSFVPFATVFDVPTSDSRNVAGQPYAGELADLVFADGFESGDVTRW